MKLFPHGEVSAVCGVVFIIKLVSYQLGAQF